MTKIIPFAIYWSVAAFLIFTAAFKNSPELLFMAIPLAIPLAILPMINYKP